MKTFNHVVTITTDITREHFKRHGLHMNSLGEELISTQINIAIKEKFKKKREREREMAPINMPWKGEYSEVD
jgi:hypothetical protein